MRKIKKKFNINLFLNLLKKNNMSVYDFKDELLKNGYKFSANQVYFWIKGKSSPNDSSLKMMSDFFKIKKDDLIIRNED